MTKKQQATQTQDLNRYDVFVVETYTDKQREDHTRWTRIGIAFPHKDGKGLNVDCNAIPVDGKFVIRLHEPQKDQAK
jgi:hypothetical protein